MYPIGWLKGEIIYKTGEETECMQKKKEQRSLVLNIICSANIATSKNNELLQTVDLFPLKY